MTTSRVTWTGAFLVLAALLPLDCRHAISEKKSSRAEKNADAPSELRADEVTDVDKGAPPEKSADPASASKPLESPSLTAHRAAMDRIHRERWAHARANWQVALRTNTPTVVPCQPLYVTITVTNTTDQARKLREILGGSEFWILVGRSGEQPRVVKKLRKEGDVEQTNLFVVNLETVVAGGASEFSDRMLTTSGSTTNNPAPKRIFNEPGEYSVYAAAVDSRNQFEVLRSETLAVTVREPMESEAPYVAFFRDGRQIPPYYGFSQVDEEAFDKRLRGRGQPARSVAFRRKVDAETIDKLREMLAKHPDPPVADDMRHYLMMLLIRSAAQHDERGRHIGTDRDVLAAAAEQYLGIAPERKQLRRRGINTWRYLSIEFDLDNARPILQIIDSWKTSSPFYEDEAESQAALDEIIAKIEARYAQEARARAAAPPPKPKVLPTD